MSGYPSRARTRKYFIGAVILFVFQLILGLVASINFLSRDILSAIAFPFDIIRALHINVMILWLLLGFIGGLYYLLPAEVERDIKYPRLIDFQFWFLLLIGAGIILSEMFYTGRNWWLVEGREYVEAGRLWDILLTLVLLTVAYNVGATIFERKKEMNSPMVVLAAGAMGTILMYIPGEIWFNSLVAAEYFRWWVVHYWVEASFELIAAGVIALVLLAMTEVRREIIEKYLAIEVALILLTGIIGQGHHYYWIGTPGFWLFLGGLFSALEPVPLFLMVWSSYRDLKDNKKPIPNKVVLYMVIGSAIGNLIGAGFFGFGHTLPQINFFTHSTQITAAHSHFATPGTYLLLVLGIAYLAVPELSGISNFSQRMGKRGFWVLVLGFLNMIIPLTLAGVVQVYLQRFQGMSFMAVQNMLLPFYGWRTIGGIITLIGGLIIAYDLLVLSRRKIPEKGLIPVKTGR
jgi:nitric oxide reductase subunit B